MGVQKKEKIASLSFFALDPVLNKELLSHERNSCPYPSRDNEKSPSDRSAIAENLQNKRFFLEKSGVQCIGAQEAKLKPLEAGSPLRIGLLASNATFWLQGFYQEKLHSEFEHKSSLLRKEMRDVLPEDDPLLKKCIDPMDALARSNYKVGASCRKRDLERNKEKKMPPTADMTPG
ncbi:hypothetical protein D5086_006506 [Populus alba]|uniref:Uncharacterized protein n=1 Tax=Populus alba TaxID=43335 RepID=A0ACC4CKX1_POPAL